MPHVYYCPSEFALENDEQQEIAEALDSLGYQFKQGQFGGATPDLIVCWFDLKDLMVSTTSGMLVLTVDRAVQAIHNVLKKRKMPSDRRNVAAFHISHDGDSFRAGFSVSVDEPLTIETLDSALRATNDAYVNYLKSRSDEDQGA